jgi:hypothetical protein
MHVSIAHDVVYFSPAEEKKLIRHIYCTLILQGHLSSFLCNAIEYDPTVLVAGAGVNWSIPSPCSQHTDFY